MAMSEELQHRFKYHPPSSDLVRVKHEEARMAASLFASMINILVPEGRERALAITKTEEAMFWANAGIARAVSNAVELLAHEEPCEGCTICQADEKLIVMSEHDILAKANAEPRYENPGPGYGPR